MTFEQKFQALQALLIFSGAASVSMRAPGDWYVSLPGVSRRKVHVTESGCVRDAKTPEEAIHKCFEWATSQEWPLQINTEDGSRLVKWNGFMWARAEAPK